MKDLNIRLRKYRKNMNLSQKKIAEILGVNRCAVIEMESGKRKISADELIKLSEFYKISLDELVYGKEECKNL